MDSSHTAFWTTIAAVVPVVGLLAIVEFRRNAAMPGIRKSRAAHFVNASQATFYSVALAATEFIALCVLQGSWPDSSTWRVGATTCTLAVFSLLMFQPLALVWSKSYADVLGEQSNEL